MPLYQRVRLLPSQVMSNSLLLSKHRRGSQIIPNKEINHQLLQPGHILLDPPQRPRIIRRGNAIGLVRPPANLIDDAILQRRDAEEARQLPELDQFEVGRMGPVQALVGQGAGVEPLGEVLEIRGVALGEGEGGGDGFAEGVGRVEGGGEEGGDGAEGLEVEVERLIGTANREGDGCLEQVSVLVKYAIQVAAAGRDLIPRRRRWSGECESFWYGGDKFFRLDSLFLFNRNLIQLSNTRHRRYYLGR